MTKNFLFLTVLAICGYTQNGMAQCTSCDYTINSNFNGNINASNGDVICITSLGSFSGNISGTNVVICNYGTISNANLNASNYTLFNYGSISLNHLNVNNGVDFENFGTLNVSGNFNLNNGGVFSNNYLVTVAGNLSIKGIMKGNTLGGNGKVTVNGTSKITNGGVFGNIGTLDLCDSGIPAGGWDQNNGTVGASVTYCDFAPSLHGEFTAQTSGSWSQGSTWGNNGNIPGSSYPSSNDSVVISSGQNIYVSTYEEVRTVQIKNGGNLTIQQNSSLKVHQNIHNNGFMTVKNNGNLVQSDCSGSYPNSGNGQYKVDRQGTDTASSYNIWCSPIQDAPLHTVFNTTNPCDIFTFNENTQSWTYDYANGYTTVCNGVQVTFSSAYILPNADGYMNAAKGYMVAGGTNLTSERNFIGTIQNGTIKIPISTTNNGHQPEWNNDDWNLIGNPYPSAIDASLFWQENAINNNRIFGAIHFWDDQVGSNQYNQYNEYATWNSLGGVSSNNSSVVPNGYIASCQGFWVEASQTDSVVFTNCMRNDNNSHFYKTQNSKTSVLINIAKFVNDFTHSKNTLIGYTDQTTSAYDPLYDAHLIADANPLQLASLIDSGNFVIQGVQRPKYNESTVIPLFVKSQLNGAHTISASQLINLPNQLQVYLVDNLTGNRTNLKQHSTEVYLDSNVAYYDRFELELSMHINQFNDLPDTLVSIGNPVPVNSLPEQLNIQLLIQEDYIILTGEIQENSVVTIFNMLGQTLMHQQLSKGSVNPQIPIGHISQPIIVQFKNSQQQLVRKAFF